MTSLQEIETLHSALGEAEKYAKDLERQLAERQWKPIETAPKDGSSILVFNGKTGAVHWDGAGWVAGISCSNGSAFYLGNPPTHWMPLPPPPPST